LRSQFLVFRFRGPEPASLTSIQRDFHAGQGLTRDRHKETTVKTSLSVTQPGDPFPPSATLLSATDTSRPVPPSRYPVIAHRDGERGRGLVVTGSAARSLAGCTRGATAVVSA